MFTSVVPSSGASFYLYMLSSLTPALTYCLISFPWPTIYKSHWNKVSAKWLNLNVMLSHFVSKKSLDFVTGRTYWLSLDFLIVLCAVKILQFNTANIILKMFLMNCLMHTQLLHCLNGTKTVMLAGVWVLADPAAVGSPSSGSVRLFLWHLVYQSWHWPVTLSDVLNAVIALYTLWRHLVTLSQLFI